MISSKAVGLVLVSAVGLAACGDPKRASLEVVQRGSVLWTKDLPARGHAFEAAAGLGAVSTTGLGEPAPGSIGGTAGVSLRFQPPSGGTVSPVFIVNGAPQPLTFLRRAEAQVYARDLTEAFQTLAAIQDDVSGWRAIADINADPISLPRAATLTHPAAPAFDPTVGVALGPLSPVHFWGGSDRGQRAAPASEPDGTASVKSVRAFYHGYCDRLQPIQPLLERLVYGISRGLRGSLCKLGGSLDYLDALSFVSSGNPNTPDFNGDDEGGFFLHGRVTLSFPSVNGLPPLLSDCTVAFNYHYTFKLVGGFLTVVPTRHSLDFDASRILCVGTQGTATGPLEMKGLAGTLIDALELELPGTFNEGAKNEQSFTLPLEADPGKAFDCDPESQDQNPCGRAIDWLRGATADGAKMSGLSLMPPLTTAFVPGQWSCVKTAPTTDQICHDIATAGGRCTLAVPAERLIVHTDKVELVLFDEYPQDDNAFAVYLALMSLAPGLSQLPHPPVAAGQEAEYLRGRLCAPTDPDRDFSGTGYRGYATMNTEGVGCGAIPTEVRPIKDCHCDPASTICPEGSKCTADGYCDNLCIDDSQCPNGCDKMNRRCK